ncbi:MAG: hypothetical protein ABI823_09825 [Bryobacteraceae bacterium]
MRDQMISTAAPSKFRLARRNTMAFPRELRSAIPELHDGRVLELDSIEGHAADVVLRGPEVQLKFLVKETGQLKGEFEVLMNLQPEAAHALAATLSELAKLAEEPSRPQ